MLKRVVSGGSRTKMIALGIGSGVNEDELTNIASAPQDQNVVLVHDFSSLTDVEEQLRNSTCSGRRCSFHVVSNTFFTLCTTSVISKL